MPKEIERKFLINKLEDIPQEYLKNPNHVDQAYISIDPEVRIRNVNDVTYTLTIKSNGELVRDEKEVHITPRTYHELSKDVEATIAKTRYVAPLPQDNVKVEIDIFIGCLKDLILAEVEFTNELVASQFVPPSWFGEEVTHNPEYKNKNLAIAKQRPVH